MKLIRSILGVKAVTLVVAAVALAAVIGFVDTGADTEPAEANPTAVQVFNRPLCVTLSIAFGGLDQFAALTNCDGIMRQSAAASIQNLVRCLRGRDEDGDGINECLTDPELLQITPEDFAAIDGLDANQGWAGAQVYVLAYVADDAPVRFTTEDDAGTFLNPDGSLAGQEWFCETGSFTTNGDPDCDGDPATEGDGVVAARLDIGPDDDRGEHTVFAIQEGIGYPATLTITGPPDDIVMESLFGKTAIQSGSEACAFEASVDAVLGAVSDANKAVIVAKALDDEGVEIAGALLAWDTTFGGATEAPQGGVALPQTPTIVTGALGNAFPQFICGGEEAGELTVTAVFDSTLSTGNDPNEETSFTITVVDPADEMVLSAAPPEIPCDGTQTSTITANVTQNGAPVADGVDVNFSVVTLGTITPFTGNTAAGVASATLTPLSGLGRGVTVLVSADDIQRSIVVGCTGVAAPPPPGEGTPTTPPPPGQGTPGGTITPPDTGSGGDIDGRGAMPLWAGFALLTGAMALVGARLGLRNTR